MLTLQKLIPQGAGLAAVLLKRAATVELDWDVRQKSRFDATDSTGRHLGVFLPRGTVVRGGDVLVAEDGSLVKVIPAARRVMQVRACPAHGSAFDLLRAAYHLGNRHVPLALQPDHLTLEPDHVLAGMLRQMHLIVSDTQAAFEPEAGAYAAATSGHGQGHAHAHPHTHEASHSHAEGAAPSAGQGHAPGEAHAHGEHAPQAQAAEALPGAPARGKPLGIAVSAAPAAPHVHGPGCGHHHHGH